MKTKGVYDGIPSTPQEGRGKYLGADDTSAAENGLKCYDNPPPPESFKQMIAEGFRNAQHRYLSKGDNRQLYIMTRALEKPKSSKKKRRKPRRRWWGKKEKKRQEEAVP